METFRTDEGDCVVPITHASSRRADTDAAYEPAHIRMLAFYDTYVAMRREWLEKSSPWLIWRFWWWTDLRVRQWAIREASRMVYGR
jgi:hypothetical protein